MVKVYIETVKFYSCVKLIKKLLKRYEKNYFLKPMQKDSKN